MRADAEAFFKHAALGDIDKEAYGLICVYKSGDQESYDELEAFIQKIYDSETGPERGSKRAILTYKILIENMVGKKSRKNYRP